MLHGARPDTLFENDEFVDVRYVAPHEAINPDGKLTKPPVHPLP